MELNEFLIKLHSSPDTVTFDETMSVIDAMYDFTPTPFMNGVLNNEAGINNGSCKLFTFARLQDLSQQQTLNCFGDYYRKDVLGNPDGTDHQNIRNFISTGWNGIEFQGDALIPKQV
ncbi:MAG: HopJ type III effector protein [Gallionella sp.]